MAAPVGRRRRRGPPLHFLALFVGPSLLLYGTFVLWPAMNAFMYSLLRWDGLGTPVYVGLKNFRSIVSHGSQFAVAFGHNVFLTVVPGVLILTLALYFAFVIHQRIPGARIFRITFFFPNVISSVAISLLWILIYSTAQVGLLNHALHAWFHVRQPVPFTSDQNLLWALVPMTAWAATGFYMVLFLAAMENIPETYYEAARLDGAGPAVLFRMITVPLIWDVITVGVIFLVIGGLKIFDTIWVMDNGQPSNSTHTMATLMYSKVFEEYNVGYGTAIAVFLFLQVLLATLLSQRLMRREALEY